MKNLCKCQDWVRYVAHHKHIFIPPEDKIEDTTFDPYDVNILEFLRDYVDLIYNNYIRKYPEIERSTFHQKAIEANKIINNPDISHSETPYLSALIYNDNIKRLELARAIMKKVRYIARLERFGAIYREYIETVFDEYRNSNTKESFCEYLSQKNVCFDFELWNKMNIDVVLIKRGDDDE